jgi:hypothetical protein
MWNRFWFLISPLWFGFCLLGYNSTSVVWMSTIDHVAHPEHEPGWLLLGSAGFVLWVMGRVVRYGFRMRR